MENHVLSQEAIELIDFFEQEAGCCGVGELIRFFDDGEEVAGTKQFIISTKEIWVQHGECYVKGSSFEFVRYESDPLQMFRLIRNGFVFFNRFEREIFDKLCLDVVRWIESSNTKKSQEYPYNYIYRHIEITVF